MKIVLEYDLMHSDSFIRFDRIRIIKFTQTIQSNTSRK